MSLSKTEYFSINNYEDIFINSYIIYGNLHQHSLVNIIDQELNIDLNHYSADFLKKQKQSKEEILMKLETEDMEGYYAYVEKVANSVFDAGQNLRNKLVKEKQVYLYYSIENPLSKILIEMESYGFKINQAGLNKLTQEFQQQVNILEKDIYIICKKEFNIASPKQLAEVLFDDLGIKPIKKSKKSGNYSTSQEVLEELSFMDYEVANLILKWRHYTKLINTYTIGLLKEIDQVSSRIHTSLNNGVIATGRLSSTNPNLQNIPIKTEDGYKIRQNFICQTGYKLISADYSQIELRILAHIAGEKTLIKAFADNLDIHIITASQIFNLSIDKVDNSLRRKAKMINFGIIYGMSAYGLATRLGINMNDAKLYIESYFKQYPGIKNYMDNILEDCNKKGYVTTLMNRKYFLKNINNKNKSAIERMAINAPIQGSASDIIKSAMVKLYNLIKKENLQTKMLLQVHDELIFESPVEEVQIIQPLIKNTMEKIIALDVSLKVEIKAGDNWEAIH